MGKTETLTAQERLMALSSEFSARYSGEDSEKFWREVRRSKDRTLYDFACSLQDAEYRVLRVLNTDIFQRVEARILKSKRRGSKRGKSALAQARGDVK